ncbi:hypothetical protein ABH935_006368 [Catenulispora sp. GAS73]|uniref:hypothetical protein n=1 Tax=Catenulispora sp. GAS73 TaxID=3156269 RepID=UPI0035176FF8
MSMTTVPPTPPPSQRTRPSTGPVRPWLLGGTVMTVCAAATFGIVMALTGSSSGTAATTSTTVTPATTSPSHVSTSPAGHVYQHAPRSCSLISTAHAAEYAPGAKCTPGFSESGSRGVWTALGAGASGYYMLEVGVLLSPETSTVFATLKSHVATMVGGTPDDVRNVQGLGDEAYLAHAPGRTYLQIAEGNALVDLNYTRGQSASKAEDEAAVITMAHDVLSQLS